jgi:hypothetical protein
MKAASLAVNFFKETEMLFRGEQTVESVATSAALMIFGHASVCYGQDTFGQGLLDVAQNMCERLGLFGISKAAPPVSYFSSMPG